MKQIEITTNVYQSLREVDEILVGKGFKIIRKSRVEDQYMSLESDRLTEDNILSILANSLLIRYLWVNGKDEYKKITYKKKEYDGDTFLSEEKINLGIDSIDDARELLEALGFKKLVDVRYDVTVYSNDDIELAFQEVEDLGLLVEYERCEDYTGISSDKILKAKEKMLKELKGYGLNTSSDYDVKKAYQLIKERGN